MVSIWDAEGQPYMQAMHAMFAFGGIISPLVTEPFLSKKMETNVTVGNMTGIWQFGVTHSLSVTQCDLKM